MSKYVIDENTLTGIGDAVRAKSGTSEKILVSELATAITNIPTGGGGGGDLPEEAFNITGNCMYRFSYDCWNWFIDTYGDKVITKSLSNISNMFYYSTKLTKIPFELNISTTGGTVNGGNLFYNCNALEISPMINNYTPITTNNMYYACYNMRGFPDGFGDNWKYDAVNSNTSSVAYMYQNCYSLRKIPEVLLKKLYNNSSSSSSNTFKSTFSCCYNLDDVINLNAAPSSLTYTSNCFSGTFENCCRLKNMTFALEDDGTIKIRKWKKQTIDLTTVGYISASKNYILKYNSGITADKEVIDDTTYAALKDDPDWFTADINYSRYNHNSAVSTINSLPDCSEYIASQSGTTNNNTIKFKGAAGAKTDGGAINTLTEEEIAVAAAKGWTVSMV